MTLRLPLTALSLVLGVSALAACSASSSSGPSSNEPAVEARSSLSRTPASSVPSSDLQAAVTANNAFAVDLYAKVRASAPAGNLFTSPLSASLALTMTYAGARGQTATEMASTLHLPSGAGAFAGQNALDQALESRAAAGLAQDTRNAQESGQPAPSASDYDLHVVNSVWGEQTYSWAQPFLDVMATSYGAGVYLEDFVHDAEQARTTINGWVSKETSDKINDLLPQGSLDSSTRMVLVNAIHLKLPWQTAFDASRTKSADFTRTDGSKVTVSMMHQQNEFAYVDDGKAQVVALGLSGGETVVIALPHGDLASYEADLAAGSAAITPPKASQSVILSLPKANFTSPTFSLAKSLQALGMNQAFDPTKADFTGLCAHPADGMHLFISDVLQKAMIGVSEEGVEAAAATAVIASGTAEPSQPVTMTVDRPYLLSIIDSSGAVLFLGHIEDPTQG